MELLSISQALELYKQVHLEEPKFGMDVVSDDFIPKEMVILQSNSRKKEGIPLRCNFYTMVFCLQGGSIRYVNQFKYAINTHSLHLLPPGSIHSFKDTFDTTQYYVILFEKDFSQELELLDFHDKHLQSVDLDPLLFGKVKDIFEEIESELKGENPDNYTYSRYLLNQLLLILKREKLKLKNDAHKARSDIICNRFFALLERNFKKMKAVYEYAELLELSPKYLSETIKSNMGKNALYFIHKRIVQEAKYLLAYTDKTIYSIALNLNFHDASQFTKFFKQKVGLSPKQYRIDNSFILINSKS